jgi:hypothetical protein
MTNTFYPNTPATISTLLGLATTATPNQGGGNNNYAQFTVPALQDYLYLIWDFRDSSPIELCYSSTTPFDACCGCEPTPAPPTVLCYSTTSSLDACCGCEEPS